jgi:hypothetical protein
MRKAGLIGIACKDADVTAAAHISMPKHFILCRGEPSISRQLGVPFNKIRASRRAPEYNRTMSPLSMLIKYTIMAIMPALGRALPTATTTTALLSSPGLDADASASDYNNTLTVIFGILDACAGYLGVVVAIAIAYVQDRHFSHLLKAKEEEPVVPRVRRTQLRYQGCLKTCYHSRCVEALSAGK